MVEVLGSSIGSARRGTGMAEMELARRFREATGDPRKVGAVRAYLRRIERREGPTEMAPEEIEAIAAALGVPADYITEQLLWTWTLPDDPPPVSPSPGAGPPLTFLSCYELGAHLVAFTEAAEASRWRDVLAHRGSPRAGETTITPVTRADLLERGLPEHAFLRRALGDLGVALSRDAVLIDPDDATIAAAVLLEDLLMGLRAPGGHVEGILSLGVVFNLERVRARLSARLELERIVDDGGRSATLAAMLRNLDAVIRAVADQSMQRLSTLLGGEAGQP